MPFTIRSVLTALLLTVCAADASAQQEGTVFLRSGEELEGTIIAYTTDSLIIERTHTVHYPETRTHTSRLGVPRADIRSVSTGDTPSIIGRTLTGLGIGIMTGLAGGGILAKNRDGDEGLGALVFLYGATGAGTLIGLLSGILDDGDEQYFDFALPRDRASFAMQMDQGFAHADELPPGRTTTWRQIQDSLPSLSFELVNEVVFCGYLFEVGEDHIVVFSNGLPASLVQHGRSARIPMSDVAEISMDEGSPLALGLILGGLTAPMLLPSDPQQSRSSLLLEAGVGIAIGGAIGYLASTTDEDGWEWHPGSGDPAFLRQFSYRGRFPAAAPIAGTDLTDEQGTDGVTGISVR